MRSSRGPGVVYTQAWVADLMLDLVGYDESHDLGAGTIVEPGCGDGAFLMRLIPRLLRSASRNGREPASLRDAIRAYELNPATVESARANVQELLLDANLDSGVAEELATSWVVHADFLLEPIDFNAKWIVGNPPYVRVEDASASEYVQYRRKWKLMSGRADVYIGFFEAALSVLEPGGRLCFICADRWMHNQYGGGLRRHVIEKFAMKFVLELHQSDVFDAPVAAYPAVTLIERNEHTSTALATANSRFTSDGAERLFDWWRGHADTECEDEQFSAAVLDGRFAPDGSWPSGPPGRLRMIAELESRLPALSDVGVSVGVGIATGADKIYVVNGSVDVDPQFVKRAVGPSDLDDGSVRWRGRSIVSPWDGDRLADLESHPSLAAFFKNHEDALRARYVGKRNPEAWWRTIDRPPADQYAGPKLIVADINDRIEPILDREGFWPLHSAYFITSSDWDLEVLGGYLLSDVAGAFVEAYSVKMAGGHLRVSAQYLKRIRLPHYHQVDAHHREKLATAFSGRDRSAATATAVALLQDVKGSQSDRL